MSTRRFINSVAKAPAPKPYNGPVFYCNEVNGLDVYMQGGCKSVSVSTIYDNGGGAEYNRNYSGYYTSIYPYGGFYKFTLEHSNGKPDKIIYAGSVIPSEYKERCIVVNLKTGDAPHIDRCEIKTLV